MTIALTKPGVRSWIPGSQEPLKPLLGAHMSILGGLQSAMFETTRLLRRLASLKTGD